jgi:hypothetical protein
VLVVALVLRQTLRIQTWRRSTPPIGYAYVVALPVTVPVVELDLEGDSVN